MAGVWLLPADGSWPPEIDIMEVLGHDMDTLYTTVHTNESHRHTSKGTSNVVPDMSLDFHTYGVNWQADYITWYFDGVQVFKAETPSDLNKPMYMIANITVGGDWPGMPNETTPRQKCRSITFAPIQSFMCSSISTRAARQSERSSALRAPTRYQARNSQITLMVGKVSTL
jgi:beta-glucanase (GH16 family)